VATAATPANAAPSRTPLIHEPQSNCELGADALPGTGTPTRGFAAIHATPRGRLATTVVLRDALPRTTYNVFVIQTDQDLEGDPLDCVVQDGTLTTNASGSGAVALAEALLPEATAVHVYLYTSETTFDYFDTQLVAVR
jgi:hypothetical protein